MLTERYTAVQCSTVQFGHYAQYVESSFTVTKDLKLMSFAYCKFRPNDWLTNSVKCFNDFNDLYISKISTMHVNDRWLTSGTAKYDRYLVHQYIMIHILPSNLYCICLTIIYGGGKITLSEAKFGKSVRVCTIITLH